jgi:hypothetical protein
MNQATLKDRFTPVISPKPASLPVQSPSVTPSQASAPKSAPSPSPSQASSPKSAPPSQASSPKSAPPSQASSPKSAPPSQASSPKSASPSQASSPKSASPSVTPSQPSAPKSSASSSSSWFSSWFTSQSSDTKPKPSSSPSSTSANSASSPFVNTKHTPLQSPQIITNKTHHLNLRNNHHTELIKNLKVLRTVTNTTKACIASNLYVKYDGKGTIYIAGKDNNNKLHASRPDCKGYTEGLQKVIQFNHNDVTYFAIDVESYYEGHLDCGGSAFWNAQKKREFTQKCSWNSFGAKNPTITTK